MLTSKWKPGDVIHWERGFTLVSIGEEKIGIPLKSINIQFEKEKLCDKKKQQLIHRGDNPTSCKETSQGFCSCLFSKVENTHLQDDKRPWTYKHLRMKR